MVDGYRLGVDFGTSNTTAVLRAPDGRRTRLVFGRDNVLPSAVYAQEDGSLLVGRDALQASRVRPECFEPHPKKCIDDGVVLLGAREVPVRDAIGAVLGVVFRAADEHTGGERAPVVTLTHPAGWGTPRQDLLRDAAAGAGATAVDLVAEPIAAGTYLAHRMKDLRPGAFVLIYDFGAGTFDASVIRCGESLTVLATAGLPDVGGLDVDQAIFDDLGETYGDRPGWSQLRDPHDALSRRAGNLFRDDLRDAKEALERASSIPIHVPILDIDAVLGREALDRLARPIVERTIRAANQAVAAAHLTPGDLHAICLVGGSSRLPLVSTMLLQRFRINAEMPDQPEFAVAEGSVTGSRRRGGARGAPEPERRVSEEPAARPRPPADPTVVEDSLSVAFHSATYHYRYGDLRQAEQEISAAVEAGVAALGTAGPAVLEGRLLWGDLLLLRFDAEAATRQFQLVLDARRAALGARDRATLQARFHLARCWVGRLGDAPRSERIRVLSELNALQEEQRRAAGADDQDTLATQALAAAVEVLLEERRARIEPRLRAVLAAQRQHLAPDDPAIYRTWLDLIQALAVWGALEPALQEAKAFIQQLRDHGEGHPLRLAGADAYCRLRTRQALALGTDPTGAEEARAAHADALRIAEAALRKHVEHNGEDHPRTILALHRLAVSLIEAGQRTTGMARLIDAARAGQRVLGQDHHITCGLWMEVARCLTQDGGTDEAEKIYRALAGRLARLHGEDSSQAADARGRLAEVVRRNATPQHRMKRWLRKVGDGLVDGAG